MRALSFSHSARYLNTLSRHSRLNSATPSASICCLPLMPSCFSTSISTGQAVRVPARLARHAITLHRAMAAEQILDRARKHVMDARPAVRRRRALEEHELRRALARRHRLRRRDPLRSSARAARARHRRPPRRKRLVFGKVDAVKIIARDSQS